MKKIKVINKLLLIIFILLVTNNVWSSEINCEGNHDDFYKSWVKYSANVYVSGVSHSDYELLYAHLLNENPKRYYINQCLNQINQFNNGLQKGDISHFKDWMICINNYFNTEPPNLIKRLGKCPILKY